MDQKIKALLADVLDNRKVLVLKKYSDYMEYLNQIYPDLELKEQIYLCEHDMICRPVCKCGKTILFFKKGNLYKEFCNDYNCIYKIASSKEKRNSTNLEIFGTENPFSNKQVQEQIKQTNLKNLGVEHPAHSSVVQEKRRATNLIKYGVEQTFQNAKIQEKKKQTITAHYGVDNPFKVPEIQEQIKQTNLKIYGSENPFGNKQIQEKIRQTNLKNLGVEHPAQNTDIMEKIISTNLIRYGVKHPAQNSEIQQRIKKTLLKNREIVHNKLLTRLKRENTNLKRYGVKYPLQNSKIQEKAKQTNLNTYGSENPLGNKQVRNKIKQTNLIRYGVEYTFQNPEIQEKIKQTMITRHGVENAAHSHIIQEKKRLTLLARYGVEHTFQNPEIQEKSKQTNIIRYGVENPLSSEHIQEQIKQTNLIKYGSENPLGNKHVREKRKQTILYRYGVEHPAQNLQIREKIKQTMMARHGVENPAHSHIIQEKKRLTLLARYDVEYTFQNPEIQEKIRQTMMARHGVECSFQNLQIREKIKKTNLIRYGVENPKQNQLINDKQRLSYGLTQETIDILDNKEKFTELLNQHGTLILCKVLNIGGTTICHYARKYGIRDGLRSNLERSVREWLSTLLYNFKTDRKILHGYEIDCYCEEKQFGIEINGLAYHGENIGHKDKYYHLWKYNECARQSVRLLHIFEDEWYNRQNAVKNIILTQLGLTEKGMGARKLNIRTISSQQANEFFDTYHVQGKTTGLQVCLGAYEGENLVGVMGFGHPVRQSVYQYELKRYCTNHKVYAGLSSRLFQHFVKHYQPSSIVSFCDKRFFLGKSYTMMGFVNDGDIPPDYQYTDYISRFHKSNFKLDQIRKKFNIDIEGKTEKELMRELGYDRIWDVGKIRFVWRSQ